MNYFIGTKLGKDFKKYIKEKNLPGGEKGSVYCKFNYFYFNCI